MVSTIDAPAFLARPRLDALLGALRRDGRRVIGPTVADGAIVYDEIDSAADLPAGWTASQAPGRYRLQKASPDRVFDYAVGPTSWKRYTFPPRVPVVHAKRDDRRSTFVDVSPDTVPMAFLGVRACEIAAMGVQDRVFTAGPAIDHDYAARRASALVIAVECVTPAETCFCTSMGTGPEVTSGFDIALNELDDGFVVRVGSDAGRRLLETLDLPPASGEQLATARAAVRSARERMGDPVPLEGLPARLVAAADSPRWAEVAERCLACTNCTLVCPTCFCTSIEQVSDLDAKASTAERVWDSCFTAGFGKVVGGNFRPRVQDRYRQWLTHKFGTWHDQFGTSGCVGCGRCITWCPVGIDVREELLAVAPPPLTPVAGAATAPRSFPIVEPPARSVDDIGQTYLPAEVVDVRQETADTTTLRFVTRDARLAAGRPGQFVMVAAPGQAVPPISISRFHADGLELTIRSAGAATRLLCAARPGDVLGLRGPLGRGWPLELARRRDVVIVTGGIGLAPLRPLIDALRADRAAYGRVQLLYGARSPLDRLFVAELDGLARDGEVEVAVTVDRAGPEWLGRVGVVTSLFDQFDGDSSDTVAYLCGPERMMEATVALLRERGLPDDHILVTLERHMECGVGLCGHCQMGRYFVCRDGPVFSVAELDDLFGREGI